MPAKSNSERQKTYRAMQQDPIRQEGKFVNSRAANISPFVQFALSLRELYKQEEIGKTLLDTLVENAMTRVEECENLLVARSLKRRMEEFIGDDSGLIRDETMTYYIYRNWAAEKKAVIHKADCSYCNHGKGIQDNPRGDKNGAWSQEYKTYEDAKNAAEMPYESHNDLEVKNCNVCLKYGSSSIWRNEVD